MRVLGPFIWTAAVLAIGAAIVVVLASLRDKPARREQPLAAPIFVRGVGEDGSLLLGDGSVLQIAGVKLPQDAASREMTRLFIQTLTRQGVEIPAMVGENAAMFRCEPFWHSPSGNGIYRGAFVRCILSEVLIASAWAGLDPEFPGLTAAQLQRLADCQLIGKARGWDYAESSEMVRIHRIRFDKIGVLGKDAAVIADVDAFIQLERGQ